VHHKIRPYNFWQQGRFHITLILYIGSLPNLTTWLPCGRGRTLFENLAKLRLLVGIGRFHWNQGEQEMCASQNMPVYINYQTVSNSIYSNSDLDLWHNDPKINRVLLSHMIPLWKGKNPIYFGVIRSKVKVTITINIIFDNRVVSTTLVRYIGSLRQKCYL
jgi:hypothetical protein